MTRYRLLLADDHTLFREGLAGIIAVQPDMDIVGEASDGLEAVIKAEALHPDLVLMDVQMPALDGIEATRQIREKLPDVTVVMLTVRDDDEKLFEAIKSGAQGYLLKDIRSKEMLAMLRGALQGEAALSPKLAGKVLKEFQRLNTRNGAQSVANDGEEEEAVALTRRELETLSLAARGASDREIADELVISLHTVKSHMRSILSKLHVNTRREAAKVARNKGLL
jgi:DNA-binding NarL/FixJ family response regulator